MGKGGREGDWGKEGGKGIGERREGRGLRKGGREGEKASRTILKGNQLSTYCSRGNTILPLLAASAVPSHGLCPNAAAYRVHPKDHTSVLHVMVQLEGTSKSSGALQRWAGIRASCYS